MTEYGPNYPYLKECERNWKKLSYRTWWAMRTYLEVIRPMNLPKKSTILSVGAGMGQLEQYLMRWGHTVYSLDINVSALLTAISLFPDDIVAVNGDALSLPFHNNSFDVILSWDLMEHLPSTDTARRALIEMERVLKDTGSMFHKITVVGEEGMDADDTHHIKMDASGWQSWFAMFGWNTFRDTQHNIPVWSRKKIGLYPVKGAFYLKRDNQL